MPGRRGIAMTLGTLRRLSREEGLQAGKRGGRKRALGTRRPMAVPDGSDQRRSMDFVSDAFTDGRRFRLLAVVDDDSRDCLALVADASLSGARASRALGSRAGWTRSSPSGGGPRPRFRTTERSSPAPRS